MTARTRSRPWWDCTTARTRPDPGGTVRPRGRVPDPGGSVRPRGRVPDPGETVGLRGRVPDPGGSVRPRGRVPDPGGTVRPPGRARLVPVGPVNGGQSTDGRSPGQPEAVRRRRHPAATGGTGTRRATHVRRHSADRRQSIPRARQR